MKVFYSIVLGLALSSCGNSKPVVADIEPSDPPPTDTVTVIPEFNGGRPISHNVSITITHHTPYCGGMAPTPEMMANRTQLQRNTSFVLIDEGTGQKLKVKTDTSGTLFLTLSPGKYVVREKYKDCTFEEFKAQNYKEPSDFYQESAAVDCYKKWWEQNLGEFEILAGDPIQHFNWGTSDRCFIGNNPCIVYSGPMPP